MEKHELDGEIFMEKIEGKNRSFCWNKEEHLYGKND